MARRPRMCNDCLSAPCRCPPKRPHICDACGRTALWDENWSWYGSLADLDDGKPVLKACSKACRSALKEAGRVPRNAREAGNG